MLCNTYSRLKFILVEETNKFLLLVFKYLPVVKTCNIFKRFSARTRRGVQRVERVSGPHGGILNNDDVD